MLPERFDGRSIPASTYAVFLVSFALILYLAHSPFLQLPYFWDELGQFVPAALDLQHDGALVPHSTVPNVHPPGVMVWLAGVWSVTGYSIAATRAAILAIGAVGVMFCFLLTIQLSRGLSGAPAFIAVLLLFVDPLFYTQSMMAQLDMPAMVGTLGGLLFFLQGRYRMSALICAALVLVKETGILLPLLCGVYLWASGKRCESVWYAAPFVVLAAWLGLLRYKTGYLFGDPGFAHYNVGYALQPMHAVVSLLRHAYYIFAADCRWIGTIAIWVGWKCGAFARPGWKFTGVFAAAHVLLVSLLGGAELERYLLPVLPIFYIAVAAAWTVYPVAWRNASAAVLALGLLAGMFVNPPYPFPYENNLAFADFVELHRSAAGYLEQTYPNERIYTAWPLTAALRRPEFGYVRSPLKTFETSDLHYSTLSRLDPARIRVLAVYSRTWEPAWGVLRIRWIRNFLRRYYEYEPEMTAREAHETLGLQQVARWTRRGQWIAIYSKNSESTVFEVRRR